MTDHHVTALAQLRWEVRQGDALALLRDLNTGNVDAVVTDPPYSSGGMLRGDRMLSTHAKYVRPDSITGHALAEFTGDNRDQRAYGYWTALWLSECLRVTRPGGVCMLFTDWRQLPTTTDALQAGGWVWRGIVPWAKPNARPQPGRFTNAAEYVVWGSAGNMPVDYQANVLPGWYLVDPPRNREHITQKPVELVRDLVKIAPQDGLILDPFCGSGTTGVAAVAEGRRFLGFELIERFVDITRERLAETVDGYCRANPAQQVLM